MNEHACMHTHTINTLTAGFKRSYKKFDTDNHEIEKSAYDTHTHTHTHTPHIISVHASTSIRTHAYT